MDPHDELEKLRVEIERLTSERDEARANYQYMLERAADQRMAGYRDLAIRVANAENERDRWVAEASRLRQELTAIVAGRDAALASYRRGLIDLDRRRVETLDDLRSFKERCVEVCEIYADRDPSLRELVDRIRSMRRGE